MSGDQLIIEPLRRYELTQHMGIVIGRHGFIITEDRGEERVARGTWEYREFEAVLRYQRQITVRRHRALTHANVLQAGDMEIVATSVDDAIALEADLRAGLRGDLARTD